MTSRTSGKVTVITGASSGFGAATTLAFAREGAALFLGARRLDRLESVARAARALGAAGVEAAFLDVSRTDSVDEFRGWVADRTAGVDVLVNNAGGAHGQDPVVEGRDEDWETMFQTNAIGVLRMCRAFHPLLAARPGSIVINVGSIAARGVYEGGAAYCAAKAAELQITRTLRLEWNGSGIRVATVDPGLAETEFSLVRFKGDAARAAAVYAGVQPLTAGDVAEAILWVASRPSHVCIDELVIKCTDQAAFHKVHRRPVLGA